MLLTLTGLLSYSVLSEALQFPLSTGDTSPFNPNFDTLVAETLAHWHTPGIAIAVIDGDQTFSKVYTRRAWSIGPLNSAGLRHRNLTRREGHTFNSLPHSLHHQVFHRSSRLPPYR